MVGENGKVLAFEPDINNFNALLKNIKKHNLSNVIPIQKGIWSETTILEFNSEGSLGSALLNVLKRGNKKTIQRIEVLSLEDVYKMYNLDRVNFIKMDIEGAELDVIKGSLDFIKKRNINFSIASYHIVNGEKTNIVLEKLFKEIGYSVSTGYNAHQTTWANK